MTYENGLERINDDYFWKLTLHNSRRGFDLVNNVREWVGAVMQDVLKSGEWGFSNYNHTMGVWGFKSEDKAKDALLEDLNIK